MMPAISSASHGQSMMWHCWWVSSQNYQETVHGVWCWLACTGTSTGATRMQPIACHTRWPPATARRGLRCCVEKASSVPSRVASGEHPGPGGDPGAALDAAPRHQPRGIGADTPMAHHLTCHQGATAEHPYPLMLTPCPSWPRLSTFHPMPGPATPAGEWPGSPLMMKMHGRMTSKPHTCLSTVLFGGMGVPMENQLQGGWKPPGEAPAGNRVTKWILVMRR